MRRWLKTMVNMPQLMRREWPKEDEMVVNLRRSGWQNEAIAHCLHLPVGKINRLAQKLIACGEIERRPGGNGWGRGARDLQMLRNAGSRLTETKRKIPKNQTSPSTSPEHFWTLRQAGQILLLPTDVIKKLCQIGAVSIHQRQSKRERYLIDQRGMDVLRYIFSTWLNQLRRRAKK